MAPCRRNRYTVIASALPSASFTETGALPTGLAMTTGGVLSGTPAPGSGGLYPITITASNGVAPDYSQQFDILDIQAPVITSSASTAFTVGTAGSFALTATGYPAAAFFVTGTLPPGVTVSNQSPGGWELSGTPSAGSGGQYTFTLNANNGYGAVVQQTEDFSLTVREAPRFEVGRACDIRQPGSRVACPGLGQRSTRHRLIPRLAPYPAGSRCPRADC